jgi:hypothetical protein
MDWAALITWLLTAGGGFFLFTIWLRNGGMKQGGSQRIRPAIICTHLALAAIGLVLWIVYVASDSTGLAWTAFVLLLIVALIGFAMLGIWLSQRRGRGGDVAAVTDRPAEQQFPTAVVGLHGVLAATTLVLVFLAALGVGT